MIITLLEKARFISAAVFSLLSLFHLIGKRTFNHFAIHSLPYNPISRTIEPPKVPAETAQPIVSFEPSEFIYVLPVLNDSTAIYESENITETEVFFEPDDIPPVIFDPPGTVSHEEIKDTNGDITIHVPRGLTFCPVVLIQSYMGLILAAGFTLAIPMLIARWLVEHTSAGEQYYAMYRPSQGSFSDESPEVQIFCANEHVEELSVDDGALADVTIPKITISLAENLVEQQDLDVIWTTKEDRQAPALSAHEVTKDHRIQRAIMPAPELSLPSKERQLFPEEEPTEVPGSTDSGQKSTSSCSFQNDLPDPACSMKLDDDVADLKAVQTPTVKCEVDDASAAYSGTVTEYVSDLLSPPSAQDVHVSGLIVETAATGGQERGPLGNGVDHPLTETANASVKSRTDSSSLDLEKEILDVHLDQSKTSPCDLNHDNSDGCAFAVSRSNATIQVEKTHLSVPQTLYSEQSQDHQLQALKDPLTKGEDKSHDKDIQQDIYSEALDETKDIVVVRKLEEDMLEGSALSATDNAKGLPGHIGEEKSDQISSTLSISQHTDQAIVVTSVASGRLQVVENSGNSKNRKAKAGIDSQKTPKDPVPCNPGLKVQRIDTITTTDGASQQHEQANVSERKSKKRQHMKDAPMSGRTTVTPDRRLSGSIHALKQTPETETPTHTAYKVYFDRKCTYDSTPRQSDATEHISDTPQRAAYVIPQLRSKDRGTSSSVHAPSKEPADAENLNAGGRWDAVYNSLDTPEDMRYHHRGNSGPISPSWRSTPRRFGFPSNDQSATQPGPTYGSSNVRRYPSMPQVRGAAHFSPGPSSFSPGVYSFYQQVRVRAALSDANNAISVNNAVPTAKPLMLPEQKAGPTHSVNSIPAVAAKGEDPQARYMQSIEDKFHSQSSSAALSSLLAASTGIPLEQLTRMNTDVLEPSPSHAPALDVGGWQGPSHTQTQRPAPTIHDHDTPSRGFSVNKHHGGLALKRSRPEMASLKDDLPLKLNMEADKALSSTKRPQRESVGIIGEPIRRTMGEVTENLGRIKMKP